MNLTQTIALLQFTQRVASGEFKGPIEFAKALLGLALDEVSVDDLKVYLSEAAQTRADAIADAAEAVKTVIL